LNKYRYIFFLIVIFFFVGLIGFAASDEAQWYISNGAGMTIEKAFPIRALRAKNGLQIKQIGRNELPAELGKYYLEPWTITLSILYEYGVRQRTQWVFRDESGLILFVASIGDNGAGFIEWYNEKGLIVEEQRLDNDGSGFFVSYTYKDNILLKSETHIVDAVPAAKTVETQVKEIAQKAPADAAEIAKTQDESEDADDEDDDELLSELLKGTESGKEDAAKKTAVELRVKPSEQVRNPQGPAVIPEFFVARTGRERPAAWADSYRYSRTSALRLIERVFYHDAKGNTISPSTKLTIRFPRTAPEIEANDENASNQPIDATFLNDVLSTEPAKIVYKTDSKRRVLSETRTGETGDIIGEIVYTWSGDRLSAIVWKSKNDERTIEYQYNSKGERISERDYKNGVLERTVVVDGNREIETLYKDEQEILKAVWQDGRKISENRLPVKQKSQFR
jgi:YD repeat-containing protein